VGGASVRVAWVDGVGVGVAEVDAREAALRRGPVAATLPRPGTGEGRQLRRWIVQVLVAERIVEVEASARGVSAEGAPGLGEVAGDRAGILGLGSVAADLLARNALARRVFLAVTDQVGVSDEDVERYWAANPELYRVPEQRVVRHAIGGDDPESRPLRTVRVGELSGSVGEAVFGASAGERVGPVRDALGEHTVLVVDVVPARMRGLDEVRAETRAALLLGARRRAFTAWLDGEVARRVRLAEGYEHPGDPRQPDNTHRH
jgi:[acyl-carrier-protein] S-malonyltransferase